MGYSVRTLEWRLTEWLAWDGTRCVARFGTSLGIELYAHDNEPLYPVDFDATENVNVAHVAANAPTVKALRAKLRARFDTGADLGCPPPLAGAELLDPREFDSDLEE